MFDLNGNVIGINTAILGQAGSIGIGFAIPSNSAVKVIDQLMEFGETKRGWLGIRIQDVTEEIAEVEGLDDSKGALVASVGKDSPAEKGGIKPGDIILEFDGQEVDSMRSLPKIVAKSEVGKKVIVKIWRNKRMISKKVTLGRLETSKDFAKATGKQSESTNEIESLKITVRLLTKDDVVERKLPQGTTGVLITKISADSPVNYLEIDNIIVEVQKTKIRSIKQLEDLIKENVNKGEKTLLFAIYNNQNQRRYLGIKLK